MKLIFFILLLVSFNCYSQKQFFFIQNYTVASGITPPTFIQEAETAWNTTTSPKTTASFNVVNGDILVAYSVVPDHSSDITISSSPSLTWTLQQSIDITDYTTVYVWTTTATSTTSMTVSFTRTTSIIFGGNALTFRNSGGVGASAKTNVASGAPSLNLTTTVNNSVIVVVNGDWSATDGASRTWRTVNSITPTSGNGLELTYFRDASWYTVYAAYYSDAGTAGSKTVGLSAPSGQKYSIIAVEIKGQ